MSTYPHCRHCAPSNPHHVEEHGTPCFDYSCDGHTPSVASLLDALHAQAAADDAAHLAEQTTREVDW
jgi:hypothetical protein